MALIFLQVLIVFTI